MLHFVVQIQHGIKLRASNVATIEINYILDL